MKCSTLRRCALSFALGLATTVAVSLFFAYRPRGLQWMPTLGGVTERSGAGWAVSVYEGPGFQWTEGWPFLDYREFIGPRLTKQFVEYPGEPRVIAAEGPLASFRRVPASADRGFVLIMDDAGWPFPALRRVMRDDVTADIASLPCQVVYQDAYGGHEWPRSEFELMGERREARRNLLAHAPPVHPLWRGLATDTLIFGAGWLALGLWWRLVRIVLDTLTVRRRTFTVAVCMLLGLLASIGVAWACAAWVDPVDPNQYPPAISGGSFGGWSEKDKPYQDWEVYVQQCPGAAQITSTWMDPDILMDFSGIFPGGPPGPLVPIWAKSLIPPDQPTKQMFHERIAEAWGWPMLAMWSWQVGDTSDYQQMPLRRALGIEISPVSRQSLSGKNLVRRALPLAIIWPGFIVDAFAYGSAALTLWTLAVMLGRGRGWWRLRRGECPKCGYPIGASPVCTECGTSISTLATGRTLSS